ncbi:MAG TPA: hypothetical protein ENH85_02610 [Candidatus Scalindua sp.]|nr:hypothetical protein [Candidatus Scalindua sp.]
MATKIDITSCKKFWRDKITKATREELADDFTALHDIKMLIGYIEQLQGEVDKKNKEIEQLEIIEGSLKSEIAYLEEQNLKGERRMAAKE